MSLTRPDFQLIIFSMSAVEDVRQVIQDFLAPELRSITAHLDAIDRRFEDLTSVMNARFDSMNTRIDSLGKDIVQVKELLEIDRRPTKLEAKQAQVA